MRKRIVLFGSIGIAKECLEKILYTHKDIEIVGVCCKKDIPSWRNEESVYSFCKAKGIKIVEMREVKNLKADIGICIRFDQLITQEIIDSFSIGIFNTHGGILPNYRGTYSNINALINGEKEYGVTLHCVDSGIDTGDIVDILKIEIQSDDTGYDLYRKGERLCFDILKKNINDLLSGKFVTISQQQLIDSGIPSKTYSMKKTIQKKKLSTDDLQNKECLNIIRAFDSPFHELAYVLINNKKVYLTVKQGENR